MKKLLLLLIICLIGNFFFAKLTFAASSLTITSAILDSSGRKITLNIGGVSGSLSPATNITGLVAKLAGTPLKATTTVSSGSTVTINLETIILSGQTITLALSTSPTSNLTDGGGNTPVGQATYAVTNNSVQQGTTISGLDSSLYYLGQWSSGTSGGHFYKAVLGLHSEINVTAFGTDLDVQLSAATYTFTVDGISSTKIVPAGWNWVSVFSDKEDTNHVVKITGPTSSNIDTTSAFRLVSVAGAHFTNPGYGPYLRLTEAPFSTYGALDGSPATTSQNGYTSPANTPNTKGELGVRFKAAVTDIRIWASQYSGKLVLYEDGIEISSTTPSGIRWAMMHLASGLDATSHLYEIVQVTPNAGSFSVHGLMLGGGTGLIEEIQPKRLTIAWYGDTIISSTNVTDTRLSDPWLSTRALGLAPQRAGNNGKTVSTYLRDNTLQVTALSPKPKIVILAGGVNDQQASTIIGNVSTPGTFSGDMKTMISNVAAGLPSSSTIFVRGILPNATTNFINRDLYTAAQRAAVVSYMAGSPSVPAYFISTDGWISSIPNIDADSQAVVPNAIGYAKIANREIPFINGIINGSGYTVSGPSTGNSRQSSSDFIVSLPGNATFTGVQTITLSDGGDGGTFIPSVGSSGVSTNTVTPTNGLNSFTFTYTPNSAGTKNILISNNQSWIDPGSISYESIFTDGTAPAVSISAPREGAVISGTNVAITANASDDVEVIGVQFILDTNTNIGIEDTTSVFGVLWDTTAVSEGTHTIVAVARDASGNYATSSAITVVIDNTTSPALSSISAATLSTTTATITWTTDEPSTSSVSYGLTSLYTESSVLDVTLTTSHSVILSGLDAGTQYHYVVVSKDSLNNTSTSTDHVFVTHAVVPPETIPSPIAPSSRVILSTGYNPAYDNRLIQHVLVCSIGELFNTQTGEPCSTNSIPLPTTWHFTQDLESGTLHSEVKLLQKYLNIHGFPVSISGAGSAGKETTVFGTLTKEALIKFQQAKNIFPARGYFGPYTREFISTH